MEFLSESLRYIVGLCAIVIIAATSYAGFHFMSIGEELIGYAIIAGGFTASSLIFGMIALFFRMHDHLLAIRNSLEGDGVSRDTSSLSSERIEPTP